MHRFFGKLETWIFYLFVFSIPFETRLIVAQWTRPFNEWTAGFVYGTDILIFLLFVFWIVRALRTKSSGEIKSSFAETFKLKWSNPHLWLVGFFIVSALSIFNSRIVGLSFYQLLKLAEFIGFYFYLRSAFRGVFEFRKTLMVIITSGIFQAAIAIAQYLKQGSLGLRLFGESPLSINATGVAVFIADSQKYLRAYGTTPHPNVLAAWLFLAIFAFYFYYFYYWRKQAGNYVIDVGKSKSPILHDCAKSGICLLGIYIVLLFGLFFTFSRVIIFLWALGVAVGGLLLFKEGLQGFWADIKQRLVAVIIVTLITGGLFAVLFWPQVKSRVLISAGEEAVTQRIFYNKIAESVTAANPVLGIGIGQFVPQLMTKLKHWPVYFYQPVHNIYLLIASEIGLIGLVSFLLFLFWIFFGFVKKTGLKRPYHFSFLIFAFSFLLMGLFDHFLWTLQQGSLIFWMTLALISLNPNFG